MTEEIKAELLSFGNQYFLIPKNTWTPEELAAMYTMYNKLNGTNKVDQGCNSCRREVISNVKDQWVRMQVPNPPPARF